MHCFCSSLSAPLAQQARLPESQRRWMAPLATSTPPRTVPHTLFRSHHRWSSSSNLGDSAPPRPRCRQRWVVPSQQEREGEHREQASANHADISSHSSRSGSSSGDSSRWNETLCRSDAPHWPTRKTIAVDCEAKSSSETAVGNLS